MKWKNARDEDDCLVPGSKDTKRDCGAVETEIFVWRNKQILHFLVWRRSEWTRLLKAILKESRENLRARNAPVMFLKG